jgi:hypothetical protein
MAVAVSLSAMHFRKGTEIASAGGLSGSRTNVSSPDSTHVQAKIRSQP